MSKFVIWWDAGYGKKEEGPFDAERVEEYSVALDEIGGIDYWIEEIEK